MPNTAPSTLRIAGAAAAAVMLAACTSATSGKGDGTFYGTPVSFAGGTVRSYLVMRGGMPSELGIAVDQAAMAGLPATGPGEGGSTMLDVPLPSRALAETPYRLAEVDWNPNGHPPAGVYDVPHFDFHFYTITAQQRDAIDPSDPQFNQKAGNNPPASQLPAGYVAIPGAVPHMGVHWVDPSSPELQGQPFTHTFLYGTWNGQVIFMEPMVTRAFLQGKPSFQAPIPQPQSFADAGAYPTTQAIYWDSGTSSYRVALRDFTQRP
jgi:hypothetical protein